MLVGAAVLGAVLAPQVAASASASAVANEEQEVFRTGAHRSAGCADTNVSQLGPKLRNACRYAARDNRVGIDLDVAMRAASRRLEIPLTVKVRAGDTGVAWEGVVSIPPREVLGAKKVRRPAPVTPAPGPALAPLAPLEPPVRTIASPAQPPDRVPKRKPEPAAEAPLLSAPVADGPPSLPTRVAALVAVLGVFVMSVSMSAFSGALRNR
ncbi:MAG: hypothetical protein ACT4PP_01065 [Sporichthyaceae bacterium]